MQISAFVLCKSTVRATGEEPENTDSLGQGSAQINEGARGMARCTHLCPGHACTFTARFTRRSRGPRRSTNA